MGESSAGITTAELDEWVAAHLEQAREGFAHRKTVDDRRVHVPIHVVIDAGSDSAVAVDGLCSNDLRRTFARKKACLLISGEGGAGKTSLACQIGRWGMAEDPAEGFCSHPMLPILIEDELEAGVPEGRRLMYAVQGQLQNLISAPFPESEGFIEALLRHGRILLIVDHLSEMTENTRQKIRPESPDFPANALIITSRLEEPLGQVHKTTIKPMRIEGNRLSSFMESYLLRRRKRDLFEDSEFFAACARLSNMVNVRHVTPLLGKLYAEQMIAAKEGTTEENLPDNIPDLMLSYINEIDRNVPRSGADDFLKETIEQSLASIASTQEVGVIHTGGTVIGVSIGQLHIGALSKATDHHRGRRGLLQRLAVVQHDAKTIAWECLRINYRPGSARRDIVLAALTGNNPEERLDYLENRLQLIQVYGPTRDKIRFTLDPLAEYLAGLRAVEIIGSNKEDWQEFLTRADNVPGAPETIKEFLLAVLDACQARNNEVELPEWIQEELSRRAGLDPLIVKRTRNQQRVHRSIADLSAPEIHYRINAARDLADIGTEAKAAVPALVAALKDDRNEALRMHAAQALANIGPASKNAVQHLIQALENDISPLVRMHAAQALGNIGAGATDSVPHLIEAIGDNNEAVSASATQALGRIGNGAVPFLIRQFMRTDAHRAEIVRALADIGPEATAAVPVLAGALKDENVEVRANAAQALVNIGPEAQAAVQDLIQAIDNDKSPLVRMHAAQALANIGPEATAAVPVLAGALKDENVEVRANAAQALANIGPEAQAAVQDLIQALAANSSGGIRMLVTRAVKNIGADADPYLPQGLADMNPEAKGITPALVAALREDSKATVNATTARVLENVNPVKKSFFFDEHNPVETILSTVRSGTSSMASPIRDLADMGSEAKRVVPALKAVPVLAAALQNGSVEVRANAARGLGNNGKEAKEAIPALAAILQEDSNDTVRANAAQALSLIGSGAVPYLTQALRNDTCELVRMHAARGLGNIGADANDAIPDLNRAIRSDGNGIVREICRIAIKKIYCILALLD